LPASRSFQFMMALKPSAKVPCVCQRQNGDLCRVLGYSASIFWVAGFDWAVSTETVPASMVAAMAPAIRFFMVQSV